MKIIRMAVLVFVAIFVFEAFGYAQVPQDTRGRDTGRGMTNSAGPGVGSVGIGSSNPAPSTATTTISINDKLAGKLKTLLPEGTDPRVAAQGFNDLKDFVAAVRASNNLKLVFGEVKHKMADGSSQELQKAIHALKPDADPKAEVKKANEQAKQDIKESKQS